MNDKFNLEEDCLNKVEKVELFDSKTCMPLYPLDAEGLRNAKDDCINFIKYDEYTLGDKETYIRKVEEQKSLRNLQFYMLNSIYCGYHIKVEANKKAKMAALYKHA
jgi:hypothetical protein